MPGEPTPLGYARPVEGRPWNSASSSAQQSESTRLIFVGQVMDLPFRAICHDGARIEKLENVKEQRSSIPERLLCEADRRAARYGIRLECDDIGGELLALRKRAYDLYGARALWNVAGHATPVGMRAIAEGLRKHGDMNAAYLAADIIALTGRPPATTRKTTGDQSGTESGREKPLPLDEFQKSVLAAIRAGRDACSPFAGGSVIQHHGFRLSDDQDMFTASNLEPVMLNDVRALEAAGFTVLEARAYDGFRECLVSKPEIGTATLQWTQALAMEYFAPVPDPDFGHRLHFADLAANMVLAAASRTEKRDFADLWMLDRHVMPLWRMACAASGKFPQENPFSLCERISFNLVIAMSRDRNPLLMTREISERDISRDLADAIHEARTALPGLAPEHLGRLQMTCQENRPTCFPERSRHHVPGGFWITPDFGECLPSFKDIDAEMTNVLITEFSRHDSGPDPRFHQESEIEPNVRLEPDADLTI